MNRAINERQPIISNVVRGAISGLPLMIAWIPVIHNEKVERVVAVNRTLANLDKILDRNPLPQSWQATIFDATGRRLAGAAPNIAVPTVPLQRAAGIVEIVRSDDGQTVVSYMREASSGWIVAIAAPVAASTFMNPTRWVQMLSWQIIALFFSVGIAWHTAQRIARPIAELENLTHCLATDVHVALPLIRVTEVRNVAVAFVQTATALRQGREKHAAVLASASDAIICTDRDGRITLFNDAATRLFGCGYETAVGERLDMFLSVSRAGSKRDNNDDLLTMIDKTAPVAWVGRRNNGIQFSAEVAIAHSIEDREFSTTLIVRDVTERQRIAMDNAMLAAVVTSSGDAIYSLAPDSTVLTWNAGAERMFGYAPSEIIGTPFLALVPDDTKEMFLANNKRVVEGQTISAKGYRRHKDGHLISVEVVAAPLCDTDRTVVGISSVMRDVTEQQRTAAMNKRLAAIVEASIDAIISLHPDGTIASWNTAAERLFGYSGAEIIGSTSIVLLPQDQRHFVDTWKETYAQKGMMRVEGERLRKDGTRVAVAVTGMTIVGSNGESSGLALIYRDISDSQRHAQQMDIVMRELSHRAKNLLAVISAMARSTASTSTDVAAFEENFSARIHGLARSHDLLVKKDWTGASLRQLVDSQLQPFMGERDDRLVVDGDDITVNPAAGQMIGLALHELATNAAKHGALRTATGRVAIAWCIDEAMADDPRLVLTWAESGGPPVAATRTNGFGRDVLETMAAESLDGSATLTFAETGVHWRMSASMKSILAA